MIPLAVNFLIICWRTWHTSWGHTLRHHMHIHKSDEHFDLPFCVSHSSHVWGTEVRSRSWNCSSAETEGRQSSVHRTNKSQYSPIHELYLDTWQRRLYDAEEDEDDTDPGKYSTKQRSLIQTVDCVVVHLHSQRVTYDWHVPSFFPGFMFVIRLPPFSFAMDSSFLRATKTTRKKKSHRLNW